MATASIGVVTTVVTADDSATASTAVLRDSAAGINGAAINGTSLNSSGTIAGTSVAKSANFTAGAATHYVCDATSGNITITLPLASSCPGRVYTFVKKDSSGNSITATGALGVSTTSTQYAQISVFSDGTNWYGR